MINNNMQLILQVNFSSAQHTSFIYICFILSQIINKGAADFGHQYQAFQYSGNSVYLYPYWSVLLFFPPLLFTNPACIRPLSILTPHSGLLCFSYVGSSAKGKHQEIPLNWEHRLSSHSFGAILLQCSWAYISSVVPPFRHNYNCILIILLQGLTRVPALQKTEKYVLL